MLRQWLEQAFLYEDAERLYNRCTRGRAAPLGASHPPVALELANVELEPATARALSVAYMLFTAYYFLLDSGTDGHPEDPVHLADLTLLLSGAWVALMRAVSHLDEGRVERVFELCLSRMAENAAAIRTEAGQIASWRDRDEIAGRRSSVGRSNSALLLYELVCVLGRRESDPVVIELLEEYLAVIQESDDLDDWRADLCAGRWTPFLKRCAEHVAGEPSLEKITRRIYLEGEYERQAANVIRRLGQVRTGVARHLDCETAHVLACWRKQRMVRERALRDWVATKLRHAEGRAR
jgi:hypothetical protein